MRQEAIYCYDLASVRFAIYPDGPDGARLLAEITEQALRYLFGARGDSDALLRAYAASATLIDAAAVRQYRAAPQSPIRLDVADFSAALAA
jgi:hypothetical protein